jgi:hypothetical protein
MKSLTHNVFSIGLVVFVDSLIESPFVVTVALAVFATFLTNVLIDRLGHDRRGGVPRRKWLTHSVVTAPIWGGVAWALTLTVPLAVVDVLPHLIFLVFFVALGALAGWSHLLLDAVTEGGVFGLRGKRLAMAHFSYDNPGLNMWFCALGLTLLFVGLFF